MQEHDAAFHESDIGPTVNGATVKQRLQTVPTHVFEMHKAVLGECIRYLSCCLNTLMQIC